MCSMLSGLTYPSRVSKYAEYSVIIKIAFFKLKFLIIG